MFDLKRLLRPLPLALALAAGLAGYAVVAQIEGTDRGVAPIDSSQDWEIGGISVDIAAPNADAARSAGWREAQRRGWRLLWQRVHGGAAPGLSDSQLDSMVSGIVVEEENVGPNRYIAKLGVLFDRVRTGQFLGLTGLASRSAPLLVIPVQWEGGAPISFEQRTEWQKAWARFRTAGSAIDYVRPSGTGADPLLLQYGQTWRPGRRWWRVLLDQFGAADVIIPQVRLERSWPGGPVVGHFSARYGPDNRLLGNFSLRVPNAEAIPSLMDAGVARMDQMFVDALAAGKLRPDSSLIVEEPPPEEEATDEEGENVAVEAAPEAQVADEDDSAAASVSTFSIQFETPDVGSVSAAEAAVRAIPGVKSAQTTSLALGGVSVMRVSFAGDSGMLRVGLSARGFQVQGSGDTLRISR